MYEKVNDVIIRVTIGSTVIILDISTRNTVHTAKKRFD